VRGDASHPYRRDGDHFFIGQAMSDEDHAEAA
jgi:hypothetical protein